MALLALVPACGFSSSGGGTSDARTCFGTIVPVCFSATGVPAAPRTLGMTEINTDRTESGSLCDQNNDQSARYCVVTGAPLTLSSGAVLTAHGGKPLVLLSTTTMDLLGDIDVSSHHAGLPGPGANPADAGACSFMTAPMGPTMGGGGYGTSWDIRLRRSRRALSPGSFPRLACLPSRPRRSSAFYMRPRS